MMTKKEYPLEKKVATKIKEYPYPLYNYYVLECLHCHNRVFVNKKNDLTKLLEDKCIKCHNEDIKYLFIGEGNLEKDRVRTPAPIDKSSNTYVLNNMVKPSLKKKSNYISVAEREYYKEDGDNNVVIDC